MKILIVWGRVVESTRSFLDEAIIFSLNLICGDGGEVFLKSTTVISLTWIFQEEKEAVSWRCFVKTVFLEISQNSQKNTCTRARVFFNKVANFSLQLF